MDDLLKVARTFRLTESLADRLTLGDELVRAIEPKLRLFVASALSYPAAEDALQESLKGIFVGLTTFGGNTPSEFWGWCYRIARNKITDQIRRQTSDRLQPMPEEELWRLVDASAAASPISAADRIDLEDAMRLLMEANPECHEFLWNHYILGFGYAEIAEAKSLTYDGVRMKVGRCLGETQQLVMNP